MSVVTYTCFDGELVEENRDGTILDYVPDSLGSIIMWVDETGLPAGYTPYWPYGEPWQEPEVECPFQFVGKYGYYRDQSGTYVRARVYEPEEGRWMTVDPLWPWTPAYTYVGDAPVYQIDPSGLKPTTQTICKGCPPIADLVLGNLDTDIFRLWGRNALGHKVAVKINECIQNSARSWGVKCGSFTGDTLSCLKDSSFSTPISCAECTGRRARWCAYTQGQFPNARIVLCYPRAFTSEGCGNYGIPRSGTSANLWATLLHELLHSCGFAHGQVSGATNEPPGWYSCNEIAACCMWKVLNGGDTNSCRKPQ